MATISNEGKPSEGKSSEDKSSEGKPNEGKPSEGKSIIKLFHDGKSGLEGLDADHINRVINDVTRGTPFYNHKLKKEQKIDARVKRMKEELESCTFVERENARRTIEQLKSEYREIGKDLTHVIMHVDMDFYFAQCEIRENPELADKPMAVGSLSMISTSNYIARKFGVRAGMPGFIGLKLCPELKLVPGNFRLYKEESRKISEVLKEYDETFTPYSLDEASINLTDYLIKKCSLPDSKVSIEIKQNANGDQVLADDVWELAAEVVQEVRAKVFEKTQLTCSAGIAPNKMLAKICSDINKPNNQYLLKGTSSEDLMNFIHKLNVKKIPGIGPVQQQTLSKGFGIETVGQLHDQLDTLMLVYTLNQMEYFTRVSMGISSFEMHVDEPRKSESREETFSPTNDQAFLLKTLRELCDRLCASLVRHDNLKGKTVTLKIKKDTFEVNVRSKTISNYVNDADTVYEIGKKLLLNELTSQEIKLRLLGIRLSNFQEEGEENQKNQQMRIDELFKRKQSEEPSNDGKAGTSGDVSVESSSSNQTLNGDSASSLSELNDSGGSNHATNSTGITSNSTGAESANNPINSSETVPSFLCPVCSIRRFNELDQLNDHIDYCLSRDCIMSSVKEFSNEIPAGEHLASVSASKRKPSANADSVSPKKKKSREITEYFEKLQ